MILRVTNPIIARLIYPSGFPVCVCLPVERWYSIRPLKSICKCWTFADERPSLTAAAAAAVPESVNKNKFQCNCRLRGLGPFSSWILNLLGLALAFALVFDFAFSHIWLHLLAGKNCILSWHKSCPGERWETRNVYCAGCLLLEIMGTFLYNCRLEFWSICVHNLLVIKIVVCFWIPENYSDWSLENMFGIPFK